MSVSVAVTVTGMHNGSAVVAGGTIVVVYVIVCGQVEVDSTVVVTVFGAHLSYGMVTVVTVTVMISIGTQHWDFGDQTWLLPKRATQQASGLLVCPQVSSTTHFLATLSKIAAGLQS